MFMKLYSLPNYFFLSRVATRLPLTVLTPQAPTNLLLEHGCYRAYRRADAPVERADAR
jgi:hypothetical protein